MRQAHNRHCIAERERQRLVGQSYISLAALSAATTRLGSGDVSARVTFVSGLDVPHTGIRERRGAVLAAIHAVPGCGVIGSGNFVRDVCGVRDVIGVAYSRP
ncbi:MAG: hypothetical protein VKJ05_07595 [Synechococcaceae cyanobacterium]|nr:hypothetical protein [Synechococcaceae cyanobacterium]